MYLLDTNVVSELRKSRPHGGVMAWFREVHDRDLFLSAMTFGELQTGVELTRRQDPAKAAEIEAWIDRIEAAWNVLPVDARTFRVWAKLMNGQSNALLGDALIAATAIVHQLQVVTRNTRDFERLEVATLNPFEIPPA